MPIINEAEENLIKQYKSMQLGNCETCKDCHKNIENLSKPISAWCIGKYFYDNPQRILFVGKNARNNPGTNESAFCNAFQEARKLWNTSWSYWSYTRDITRTIFGDNCIEHIAFTNIVKCNDSPTKDTTSSLVKTNCILNLRVLRNELEIIRPTHIIFYTAKNYDDYIASVFDDYKPLDSYDNYKLIGRRKMPWQRASAVLGNQSFHVLRVGHPQFKKKDSFVSEISDWIKAN